MYYLGTVYDMKEDGENALKWYLESAISGYFTARVVTSQLYTNGRLGDKNYVAAYSWIDIAFEDYREDMILEDGIVELGTKLKKNLREGLPEEYLESVKSYKLKQRELINSR